MSAVATMPRAKQRHHRTILSISPEDSRKQNYITILNGMSNEKTKEAAQKAEDIIFSLELDQHKKLSVLHFASVINCWANATRDASQAEAILLQMIDHSNNKSVLPSVLPNSHCFSGVMKAYINSCRGDKTQSLTYETVSQKCEDLLDTMNDLYTATLEENVKPNTVVFNTLLSAYAEEVTALFLKSKINGRENLYPNVLDRGRKNEAQLC